MPMLWLSPVICTRLTSRMAPRLQRENCSEPPWPNSSNILAGTFAASACQPPIACSPVGISSAEKTMMSTLCSPSFTAAAAMPPRTM